MHWPFQTPKCSLIPLSFLGISVGTRIWLIRWSMMCNSGCRSCNLPRDFAQWHEGFYNSDRNTCSAYTLQMFPTPSRNIANIASPRVLWCQPSITLHVHVDHILIDARPTWCLHHPSNLHDYSLLVHQDNLLMFSLWAIRVVLIKWEGMNLVTYRTNIHKIHCIAPYSVQLLLLADLQ